jgi:hypothetical protein
MTRRAADAGDAGLHNLTPDRMHPNHVDLGPDRELPSVHRSGTMSNSLWPSLRADDEIIVVDNDTHLPRLAALARAHPFVATIPAGHTPKNHFGPEARRLELRLT